LATIVMIMTKSDFLANYFFCFSIQIDRLNTVVADELVNFLKVKPQSPIEFVSGNFSRLNPAIDSLDLDGQVSGQFFSCDVFFKYHGNSYLMMDESVAVRHPCQNKKTGFK
jgi:hypothetical protein